MNRLAAKIAIGAGALLILAFGVAGVLFIVTAPTPVIDDGPYETEVLEGHISTIATPVSIPLEQLRQVAEVNLTGEIYQENREIASGVNVLIQVLRRDEPIRMEMVSSWLTTKIPLHVIGTPSINLGPFRLPGGSAGRLDADIDVTLRTRVSINSDWSIAADTDAELEVGRADLTVGGRSTDMTSIVSEILRRNVDRVTRPLDDYLEGSNVQAMMEPVWQRFASPILVSTDPPVWLRVEPQEFSLSPPDLQAENIRFDIGVTLLIDSVVGERPPDIVLGPIPPLGAAQSTAGTFSIAIPVSLRLDEATRILSEQISGREDSLGENRRVRWLGVRLGGGQNRVRIAIDFEAETGFPIVSDLSGTMVLEGRPSYDPGTRTLTMRNVDYTLDSNSMLAGIADRLVHDRLRDRIQSELVFPMDALISDIQAQLQMELENVSFGEYGTAEADIIRLEPRLLNVSDNAVELAVIADGTLELNLNLTPVISRTR